MKFSILPAKIPLLRRAFKSLNVLQHIRLFLSTENSRIFYTLSGIFLMIFLQICAKQIELIVTDIISAIGNENQNILTLSLNSIDKIKALGTKTTSWRQIETIIERTPLPNAWKTEPITIQKPANIQLIEIILNAGTPISIICCEASNIWRS